MCDYTLLDVYPGSSGSNKTKSGILSFVVFSQMFKMLKCFKCLNSSLALSGFQCFRRSISILMYFILYCVQGCVAWWNVCLSTVWSVWLVLPWRGPHVQPWSHRSTDGYTISLGGGLPMRAYSSAAVLQKCRLLGYKCVLHTDVHLGISQYLCLESQCAGLFCICGISIYELLISGG